MSPDSTNRNTALVEGDYHCSYAELDQQINQIAAALLAGSPDLCEERIALFLPASVQYVAALQAVWRAGGIVIPLNVASAVGELEHYLTNASVTRLVSSGRFLESLRPLCGQLGVSLLEVAELTADAITPMPVIAPDRRAMMLFTSGTTSKPKGVVTTHRAVKAQIASLVEAWEWSAKDAIPLFLPVHHIHGIINILNCALSVGATVHLYSKFDVARIADQVASGAYSLFMAVPTIYVKLIEHLQTLEAPRAAQICAGFAAMRLNVSGSAACPVPLFNQWRQLTGQVLLERYGMTEIGMGLSNPYRGERRAGYVGQPLPGVQVQLFDDKDQPLENDEAPGEIRIKGDNLFLEYWNNPKATAESFIDGWFCTGDMAVIENGYYRIMGRSSIDIIKSGGYKLSALEIEGVLLDHEAIAEVAVIGVADPVWGESVVAYIVTANGAALEYEDLKEWCSGRLSAYKIPKAIRILEALPRNAMGKVTKPALKALN